MSRVFCLRMIWISTLPRKQSTPTTSTMILRSLSRDLRIFSLLYRRWDRGIRTWFFCKGSRNLNIGHKPLCPVASSKKRRLDAPPDLRMSAIRKLDSILQSASNEDWELIRPEFPMIHSLRKEIAILARQVTGMMQNGQPREWSEMEERYRSCAAEIP